MKIIGFVIILNALILTGWWVSTDHPYKTWVVTSCIISLFAGSFLILQDRAIEITLKGIGTIKAAAEQASTDATAIASLKKRVEAQSATVDLVAKSANNARQLVDELDQKSKTTDKKIAQLDETTQDAHEALQDMKRATDLATTLLAAQNDNWTSFEQLHKWNDDKAFPLRGIAGNAYVKIRLSYKTPLNPGYLNINWSPSINPSKVSLPDFLNFYSTLNPVYHAHLVHVVWGRSDISKSERMSFLIQVLKTSNSLTAKHYAAKFFVQATGDKDLKWEPFNMDALFNWWKKLGDEID